MTTTTSGPVRFATGAAPLEQRLVTVDEEVLAEHRGLHTEEMTAPPPADGPFDLRCVLPAVQEPGTPVISGAMMPWLVERYAGATGPGRPELSPLLADLHGLVPALFTTGEADPLVDDSVLMANRWALAGNPARLDIYPEATHAFDEFGTRLARLARTRIADWVRHLLDPTDRYETHEEKRP
jgi:pimeloyl-ACP methyl ester carboxylesterase